jgi:RNA polymerase sigma-54 factor
MSYQMLMKLQPKLKQTQNLIMLPKMQQALRMLQAPVMEMAELIEEEMQQNPLLEYSKEPEEESAQAPEQDTPVEQELAFNEQDFEIFKQLDEDFRDHFQESGNFCKERTLDEEKLKAWQESSICDELTLFEHLMRQAHETFQDRQRLVLAEQLIGNFDENGFFKMPLEEIAQLTATTVEQVQEVLEEIQAFEPFGVGATSLQESLLIQMRCLHKQGTLAYTIVAEYYEELLHNRLQLIQKRLGCTQKRIQEAIDQIAKLDLHPGLWHSKQVVHPIVPDLTLKLEGENLLAAVDDETLPPLRLNNRYLRMLEDPKLAKETKDFIKRKVGAARWLMRNIHQRSDTLIRIGQTLATLQRDFFMNPEGKLVPITMKRVAEELSVHESTVARAVANKYIDTPKGIFPLRAFFTTAYVGDDGADISARTVRDALKALIDSEDKSRPKSDQALSHALKEQGISCARRTVAKYRTQMNIGSALQRKKF